MAPEMPRPVANKQIVALDGVRGVAVLLVVLVHLQQSGVVPARFSLLNMIASYGWCGVDLFFVLSGFLITLGLLESKLALNYFSGFYLRRILRIFPLYYAVLGAAFVCNLFFADWMPPGPILSGSDSGPLFPTWKGWISHALYFQNWWMPSWEPKNQDILGHFWSLGIEEQFYLLWPLAVWLLPCRRLLVLCAVVCVGAVALRIFLVDVYGIAPHVVLMNTATRVDTLLLGAVAAIVVQDPTLLQKVRKWLPGIALLSALSLGAVALLVKDRASQLHFMNTFGFTALGVVFAWMVTWSYMFDGRRNAWDRLFSLKPLRLLGRYSYGLYVYHLPIIVAATIIFGSSPWFGREVLPSLIFCIATVGTAICTAIASYELFEKRFLRLKRNFSPRFHEPVSRSGDKTQPATTSFDLPRRSAG